jgi:predicted unusual protein kinase regulating ubiquinone biosynthesis (AarF/ABC1/UbiB family)
MLRTRYRRILFFWARVLLSVLLWEIVLPRVGLRGWSRRTRTSRLQHYARQYRALAIQLGGVLIKVGQFLSARVDVLPPEFTQELAGLQDEVPAEAFDAIRQQTEAELGGTLREKYAAFETTPLAAASLGQVYRAQLQEEDGSQRNVVVKVQRPNIEAIINTDLAALRRVSKWVQWYGPINRRINLPALLDEFTRVLYEELDYLAEGRNAETFDANFRKEPGVRVPHVIWSHTTRRVLTLEDVSAIKISDYEAITAAGIDRAEVANRLIHVYLKQIFEDGFFHADPHPGNIFISPAPPVPDGRGAGGEGRASAWTLTFIDFGMVGHISHQTRLGMRELLIAVGTQDAGRVIKAYQMLDFLLPGADLAKLEQANQVMFERFWGKSMSELQQIDHREMMDFAVEFRDLLYSLPFQVPQDLIFLGRCVGILSGMATGLNPNFNVWDQVAPFAQKIIMQEAGGEGLSWLTETGEWLRKLVALPVRVNNLLEKAENGQLVVRTPELTEQVRLVRQMGRQISAAVVFTAFLFGGIQLYLGGAMAFATLLFAGAAVALGWLVLRR